MKAMAKYDFRGAGDRYQLIKSWLTSACQDARRGRCSHFLFQASNRSSLARPPLATLTCSKDAKSTVLSEDEMIVVFRRHTLSLLDDSLFARQAKIPHQKRSPSIVVCSGLARKPAQQPRSSTARASRALKKGGADRPLGL
jgi:hypothetical protein